MIPKLSAACQAIRSMVHTGNINKVKSIYYIYPHSVIKYGIIFWGSSSNSGKIFTLQMKIVRIMASAQPRTSCKSLFKQLEILPASCLYTLSLWNFIICNQEIFQRTQSLHNINKRNKYHIHRPNVNLSCFQERTFYAGIKIFNILPPSVTILKNDKAKFKATLRKYIHTHPFCSVYEFLWVKMIYNIFLKMCLVFYTVNLYMCIHKLFHILMSS